MLTEYQQYAAAFARCRSLSTLEIEATPPFDYAHDHFGYRDRLSQPAIEGTGDVPHARLGCAAQAGRVFPWLHRRGRRDCPVAASLRSLTRNGSFLAYRRMEEHVGAFPPVPEAERRTHEEQELVAAKLMGRWRSGAPLVLAPKKDDPQLGADPQRNNDFNYAQMDPHGYAVPLGSHMRRMNPRDTASNMSRRRMIRRGGTYGPPLPEDAPDDGAERGIAAFIGCASLVRQFEFAQNVWVNDQVLPRTSERTRSHHRHSGRHARIQIPNRPVRKRIVGLPAFTTVRGGAYFFLPGIKALRFLAGSVSAPA